MVPKNLTTVERQILTNQYQLLAQSTTDPKTKKRYERNHAILFEGVTGLYHLVFDVNEEAGPIVASEVHRILAVYAEIQELIDTLDAKEKTKLELDKLQFRGFQEGGPHHAYLKFSVEHDGLDIQGQPLSAGEANPLDQYRQIVQYQDRAIKRLGYLRKKDLQNIINFI